jgi:hypothetical protein
MQLGARRLRPLLAIPQTSPFKEGGVRYDPCHCTEEHLYSRKRFVRYLT